MSMHHKITIGNTELIALQDSWGWLEPGGFYVGIETEAWDPYREWVNDDGLTVHNYGCFLVKSGGKNILVDTGLGHLPNLLDLQQPPSLLEAMADAGTSPLDIDLVLLTHLHWDHTGWNTRNDKGDLELTFPNASYVVQQREYDYWTSPGDKPDSKSDYDRVLAPIVAANRLEIVGGEYTATNEVVAVPTPGHTPGHVSFAIISGGERAYILGDVANKPVQISEPKWYTNYDLDPVEATKSRLKILDRAEKENALIACGHFPHPSMGHIIEVNGRRSFHAVR